VAVTVELPAATSRRLEAEAVVTIVVVDTGPLVVVADRDDAHHQTALR